MSPDATDRNFVHHLSLLTLGDPAHTADSLAFVASLSPTQRETLHTTADSHHVIIRAFTELHERAVEGADHDVADWSMEAITKERARIDHALPLLDHVCRGLNSNGCPTTVIKSLDHWPDLGNDLELYSTSDERQVARVMLESLNAHIEPRSWGDRLAKKWNFAIPGLRESIEIHCQRLGQTGEHTAMAKRFVTRRTFRTFQGLTFPVPAPEERVIVATLQRMYRHFYFRLSDILNTAVLLDSHAIDFDELRNSADLGCIWPGVATYLKLVCDYVRRYRGTSPALSPEVAQAAVFGGDVLTVKGGFLRVPHCFRRSNHVQGVDRQTGFATRLP